MKNFIKNKLFKKLTYSQIVWIQKKKISLNFITSLKYHGKKIHCPICGGNFRKFLPTGKDNQLLENVVGSGYRKNARCPRCNSIERHRLIYLFLKNEILAAGEKIKILHVAPEIQLIELLTTQNIEYISGDIDPRAGKVKVDLTDIDYPDNFFDGIIANHVLEHIPDDTKAMREIYRVLRPNGWAISQVPIDLSRERTYKDGNARTSDDRELAYGIKSHYRIYGNDYKLRLEQCGFTVERIKYCNKIGSGQMSRMAIDEKEDIYFCIKK